jgi:hypothetical protein
VSGASRKLFLVLILLQAAHSVEECWFRLYDVLLPARIVAGLFTQNLPLGFALANIALVSWGSWCYLSRVKPAHPSARSWAWFWTVLEALNGTGHLLFALDQGSYFPGALTAPFLLATSLTLAFTLRTTT